MSDKTNWNAKAIKKRTPREWTSLLVQELLAARTENDLKEANNLADELVTAGIVTQEEVDALWDDLEPDLAMEVLRNEEEN